MISGLLEGDALFVPQADPGRLLCWARFPRPGAYELWTGPKLLDAIGRGGAGADREKALLEKIRIFPEGVSEEPRMLSIIEGDSIGRNS